MSKDLFLKRSYRLPHRNERSNSLTRMSLKRSHLTSVQDMKSGVEVVWVFNEGTACLIIKDSIIANERSDEALETILKSSYLILVLQ